MLLLWRQCLLLGCSDDLFFMLMLMLGLGWVWGGEGKEETYHGLRQQSQVFRPRLALGLGEMRRGWRRWRCRGGLGEGLDGRILRSVGRPF